MYKHGKVPLGELIEFLEIMVTKQPEHVVTYGFTNPHSYRGYYEDLAFEPTLGVPVRLMLGSAKYALGNTFQGYKGGYYDMNEYTTCWISNEGSSGGELIGHMTLAFMFNLTLLRKIDSE